MVKKNYVLCGKLIDAKSEKIIVVHENKIINLKDGYIMPRDEDSTKDINTMENVIFVMKNGKVYKDK